MKETLLERYTPEVIALAEQRRSKLNYQPIHVGKSTTCRIDRILSLLYQTHQNYYFGHFNAACVLGGVLFEQAFICLLEEEIQRKGLITCRQDNREINITDPNDLADQSLLALIHMAKNYKMIPRQHLRLTTELRIIRNYLMHDNLGNFMPKGENFEFDILTKTGNTLNRDRCGPYRSDERPVRQAATLAKRRRLCFSVAHSNLYCYEKRV